MKKYVKPIIFIIVLYVIHFIVSPLVFSDYFPSSNEASLIFIIPALLILVFAIYMVNDRILCWLTADLLYFILIMIYSANGAYGIGMRGMNLDGMHSFYSKDDVFIGALIAVCIIFLLQTLIKLSKIFVLHITNRKQ
ncbi:MAG: hypothetical protein UGF89_08950 [Acutalibacteraceae bacterium]|nr:hypothetical protein [Acutalibacteraceae bacterium]